MSVYFLYFLSRVHGIGGSRGNVVNDDQTACDRNRQNLFFQNACDRSHHPDALVGPIDDPLGWPTIAGQDHRILQFRRRPPLAVEILELQFLC